MRGVFQQVEDVVHPGDELVDVVAVDRGDEGFVQQFDGIVGDPVGLLFDAFDGMHADFEVVEAGHELDHLGGALDAQIGMLLEQLKKFSLAGHQTSKHIGS